MAEDIAASYRMLTEQLQSIGQGSSILLLQRLLSAPGDETNSTGVTFSDRSLGVYQDEGLRHHNMALQLGQCLAGRNGGHNRWGVQKEADVMRRPRCLNKTCPSNHRRCGMAVRTWNWICRSLDDLSPNGRRGILDQALPY